MIKEANPQIKTIADSDRPVSAFNKAVAITVCIVFCLFIFGGVLVHYVAPDREFSQSENRVLAKMPAFSVEKLLDGSFMSEFESYLTDQFPLRDSLISAKTFLDGLMGIHEQNGAYIGENGFIFDTQTPFDEAKAKELTDAIGGFASANKGIKTAVLIAPNSSYTYSELLPSGLIMENQHDMLLKMQAMLPGEAKVIDTFSVFKDKASESPLLYYKTDHHWTTDGAYLAFGEIAGHWGLDTQNINYEFYTLSTEFEGTLSSKAGLHSQKDEVKICVPQGSEGTYLLNYEAQGKKTATFFEKEKLAQKNQYEVFLGGNFDKVIVTTMAKTQNTLLLIKDSYANCLLPMLTPYFSEIVVIDPRYLTDSFSDIMDEYTFTHALFLYNMNTFLGDTSLAACLG